MKRSNREPSGLVTIVQMEKIKIEKPCINDILVDK